MESVLHIKPRRIVVIAFGVVSLAASGCGDSSTYKNADRPASPILVGAIITQDSISVSPRSFGAGPVNLVITNQTTSAQQVTFKTDGDQAGFKQQAGPISPRGVVTLKADIPAGGAVVQVDGATIKPAHIKVGKARPSAQNELLQP